MILTSDDSGFNFSQTKVNITQLRIKAPILKPETLPQGCAAQFLSSKEQTSKPRCTLRQALAGMVNLHISLLTLCKPWDRCLISRKQRKHRWSVAGSATDAVQVRASTLKHPPRPQAAGHHAAHWLFLLNREWGTPNILAGKVKNAFLKAAWSYL